MRKKQIKNINKDLDRKDLDIIAVIITAKLRDKGINFNNYSFDIDVNYQAYDSD